MRRIIISLFSLIVLCSNAHASIVITGTRVIYPSDAREVTVKLSNEGHSPLLVQSWLDKGNEKAKPDQIKVPFTLTPPINRVEPGNGQTLRIRSLPNNLPADRESVFWLNVLEIPQGAIENNENYIQVAFRSRIKFFYRPAAIKDGIIDAPKKMVWRHAGKGIKVKNPTPYYISLATITSGGKSLKGRMLAPFSENSYTLSGNQVSIEYINDFGAVVKQNFKVL